MAPFVFLLVMFPLPKVFQQTRDPFRCFDLFESQSRVVLEREWCEDDELESRKGTGTRESVYTTYSHSHRLVSIHFDTRVVVTAPPSIIGLFLKDLEASLDVTVIKCLLIAKGVREVG